MVKIWNWLGNLFSKASQDIYGWVSATAWILGKATLGALLGIAAGKHGIAFAAFAFLVVFDWLTCRYAICRNWVADECGIPLSEVGFWVTVRAWNKARGEGYWQSRIMRGSGWDKIKRYILWVIVASVADMLTSFTLGGEFWVDLTLGYFGITEIESIFENFSRAGFKDAEPICNLIKDNKARFGFKREEEVKK